jgi:hypothetical protein
VDRTQRDRNTSVKVASAVFADKFYGFEASSYYPDVCMATFGKDIDILNNPAKPQRNLLA